MSNRERKIISGGKVDSCIVVVFDENDVIDRIIINYLIEE